MRLNWSNIGKGLESIAQAKRESDYRKAVEEEERKYRAPEAVETPRYFDTEGVEITPVEGADLSQYLTSPGDVETQYRAPSGGLYRDMASAEAATPQAPSMRQQLITKAGLAEKYGLDTKSKELMESASKLGYLDYYDELATEKRTAREKKVKAEDAFSAILRAAQAENLEGYDLTRYLVEKGSYDPNVAGLVSGYLTTQNQATEAMATARLADLKQALGKGIDAFIKRYNEIVDDNFGIEEMEVGGEKAYVLTRDGEPTDQVFSSKDQVLRTIKAMLTPDNALKLADDQLTFQKAADEEQRKVLSQKITTQENLLDAAQARLGVLLRDPGSLPEKKQAIERIEKEITGYADTIKKLEEQRDATIRDYSAANDPDPEDIAMYADATPEQAAIMERADPRLKLRPSIQAMRERRQKLMMELRSQQGLGAPASDVPTGLFNPNAPAAPGTGGSVFAPPRMKDGGLIRRFADGGAMLETQADYDRINARTAYQQGEEKRRKEATKDRVEKLTAAGEAFSGAASSGEPGQGANLSYTPLEGGDWLSELRKAKVDVPDLSQYMSRGGMYRNYARGGLAVRDYRRGGDVDGPGTPTSDSIPAYLSDGEFVINERAMRIPGVAEMAEAANNAGLKLRDGKAKKKNSKAKA